MCLLSNVYCISLIAHNDSLPAFNTLRTPTSPAFTLLGVAPTNVERPNTPKDFAISLLNRINYFSALPQDFAMEFSPYWMFTGAKDSLKYDTVRSVPSSILKTGTLSLATAQISTDTNKKVTGLSAGFRLLLLSGTMEEYQDLSTKQQQIREIERKLDSELTLMVNLESTERNKNNAVMVDRLKVLDSLKRMNSPLSQQYEELIKQNYEMRNEQIRDSIKNNKEYQIKLLEINQSKDQYIREFQDRASIREGWFLELAGAAVWTALNGVYENTKFDRWGIWTTGSYQHKEQSYVIVARYISTVNELQRSSSLDVGGRFIYSKDKFSVSIEGVLRKQLVKEDIPLQWGLVAGIDYLIAPNTWAVVSFGRDYNSQSSRNLVAQLGLTFNIGNDRFILPDLSSSASGSPKTQQK